MKKKLVSIVLATVMVSQGSTLWAVEKEGTIQIGDDIKAEAQDESSNENIEDEETKQVINWIDAPESVNDESAYIMRDEFTFIVGSKKYYKNGSAYNSTAAMLYHEGRNYLPVRFATTSVIEGEMTFDQASGKIVISKNGNSLQMTIGSKGAYLNGTAIILENGPMVKDGTTYIPTTILRDYFNYKVSYDSENKTVKISGEDKGINNPPVAEFSFGQSSYVAGTEVQVLNQSRDSEGYPLKDKLWCVINEDQEIVTNKEISKIFKKPKVGIYRIGLKVQDQYGLWSEWFYKEITILPNQAPEIAYLGTDKNSYAQGEKITYNFYYQNEEGEAITNEKWTYRHANEEVSKAIIGKPEQFFTSGDYIISLQLDDSYGNRSEAYETKITITDEVLSSELNFRFTQGKIGDIIDNYQDVNYRDYPDATISSSSLVPGTTIMSDSPEEVTREGVLYSDTINGKGRILLHHINNFPDYSLAYGEKKIILIAENKTNKPATVTLDNKVIKGPITDILYIGQRLLYDYLAGTESETFTLQPGERKYIYDSGTKWTKQTCVSGLMDVTTTSDVTFTMAAIAPGTSLEALYGMEKFEPNVHPRGTFEGVGIKYNLTVDGTQPTKLVLGNGEAEWVKGYDVFSQSIAYNKGNYGISYYITITATEDMGIILNPRADVFRGAIKWVGEGVYNVPNTGIIYSNKAKAISLGTIKAGETKTLEYMLPNGSAAPVVLAFIPKAYWDN